MLKPRALTSVLAQANSDGVESTFLFKQDGTLLAHASVEPGFFYPEKTSFTHLYSAGASDPRVCSAIASNIWTVYQKNGRASLNEDNLQFILLDCEDGHVAIVPINTVLLCLYGSKEVGFGMMKAKCDALVNFLQEPLAQVAAS